MENLCNKKLHTFPKLENWYKNREKSAEACNKKLHSPFWQVNIKLHTIASFSKRSKVCNFCVIFVFEAICSYFSMVFAFLEY